MKLDLNPEVEASLLAQAAARGLSLEAYLDQVLKTATAGDIYVEKHRDVWTVRKSHTERASAVVPTQAVIHQNNAQDIVARLLELRKGNLLPEGVTIRDLIHEGRA